MDHGTIGVNRKSCVFIFQTREPIETLKQVATFFPARHIMIDHLQLYCRQNDIATLSVHCEIEKDRIGRTVYLLEQLPGVVSLKRMEEK